MKTIRSKRLVLQTGRERLYEIDLVELDGDGEARFIVNYRYGWAGAELQEGTRTPDPVALDAAEQIFESLVLSRRNQGYADAEGGEAWAPPAPASSEPEAVADGIEDPRSARLMHLLGRLATFPDKAAAKLIWRIGQVRLVAAAPLLADYVRDAEPAAARVLPYAFLRCGHAASDTIAPALEHLAKSGDATVAASAAIAVSLISSSDTEADRLRAGLPEPVAAALGVDDLEAAATRILEYLAIAVAAAAEPSTGSNGATQQKALLDLYLLSCHAPETKTLVLRVLEQVPFRPFLFRAVRRIYKAAEATDDAAVFAVFCERFEVEAPAAQKYGGRVYIPGLGRVMERAQAFGSDDARAAWSDVTRAYFRRRIWRHLRRTGQLDDPRYVELAAACLMRADEAADPPSAKSFWHWDQATGGRRVQMQFPALSRRYAIHHILHGAGGRFTSSGGAALRWRYAGGEPISATGREEPFAALWDQAPERVLSLLTDAPAEQVAAFAGRILADNRPFRLALPVAALARLLASPSEARFRFAYETVQAQFAEGQISGDIVPALFRANRDQSVELGKTILNARPDLVTSSAALSGELILAVRAETAEWLGAFWTRHAAASNRTGIVSEVIDQVRTTPWEEAKADEDKSIVRLAAELLAAHFKDGVNAQPLSSLVGLSQVPAVPAQLLAVLLAAMRPDGLTAFDPAALAENPDPDLQAAAAELLANANIEDLARHENLVAAFLVSPVERARKVSRDAAIAIAEHDPAAAARLADRLLEVLYRAEQHEGVRDDVVRTFEGPLLEAVRSRGPDLTWSLLRARSEPARRVGARALTSFPADVFSMRKIARLGSNDQAIARNWALAAIDQRIDEVRRAPQEIFSLLDGDWDDSREAAYDLIRQRLEAEDWTPEAVVGLCDCTTLPAQRFGREILGKVLSKEHSEFFLMRLSEHPAAGFRLTIARLIREYAAGDPAKLRKVAPALRTILSRVFSSRAAKDQIHSLIEAEIEAGNGETLAILAELLERVSATCAVQDRARVLAHIVNLKTRSPDLIERATLIAPEVRDGRTGEAGAWK